MADKTTREIPIDKERLVKLREVFEYLTNDNKNWGELTGQGIYPLYINGQLRGVRLGNSEIPAESGSVCLQAMVHTNEPAGLAGLEEALNWWKGLKPDQKKQVSGDVYLMFTGEVKQARHFFKELIDSDAKTISIEKLTSFRSAYPVEGQESANRNRVPFENPHNAGSSQQVLWDDYHEMEEKVYSKCVAREGEKPSYIIGLHTFSAPGHITVTTNFSPYPAEMGSKYGDYVVQKIKDHTKMLFGMMGAEEVIIENHPNKEIYFSGASGLDVDKENPNPITDKTTIKCGFFECGQHLDPKAEEVARNAVMNALEYKFGPELVHVKSRPASHTMNIYANTGTWFAPGSPRAQENNLVDERSDYLMPRKEEGKTYGNMHLITGNELSDADRKNLAATRNQERFRDLPDNIWNAIVSAKPDQLGNVRQVEKGQPIAYVDVLRGKEIEGRSLIYAPHSGTVFMAPLNPEIPANQREYVLLVPRHKEQVTVELPPVGRSEGMWAEKYIAEKDNAVARAKF